MLYKICRLSVPPCLNPPLGQDDGHGRPTIVMLTESIGHYTWQRNTNLLNKHPGVMQKGRHIDCFFRIGNIESCHYRWQSALPMTIKRSDWHYVCMMTSGNGNIFRVTGPLCGEFTGHASVTSYCRAPYGLFPGCFAQKSYVHSRGPHGPRAAPYEFCLPVRCP